MAAQALGYGSGIAVGAPGAFRLFTDPSGLAVSFFAFLAVFTPLLADPIKNLTLVQLLALGVYPRRRGFEQTRFEG